MSQPTPNSETPLRLREFATYVVLCAIWGTTWVAIRVVVADVPPLRAAGLRFVLAAALLFAGVAVRGWRLPQGPRQWRAIGVLGITMMALPYGLLFWAEQYIASSMAALLYTALPLVVAVLTPLMTHHVVPRRAVFALVLGSGGILVLFANSLSVTPRSLWGGVAVLGAVASTGWSVIYAKLELAQTDSWVTTAWQLVIGSAILLAGSAGWESAQPSRWTPNAVLALLFLAVAGSAVAFALYYWLLKRMLPYQITSMSLVIPIVAMVEGALLLREPIPLTMMAAAALVLASVGFVLRAPAENDRVLTLREESE